MRKGGRGWGWLLAALCCCILLAPASAEVPPPGPPASGGGPVGARYPVSGGRFTSRHPEPLPDIPPTLRQLIKRSPYDFDPQAGLWVDEFTLWVVDDLGRPQPGLQSHLRLHGRDLVHGDYHLSIQLVEAPALTDLYCYIRYRQERWAPVSAQPGSAFGLPGDRLWLSELHMPGLVGIGVTRIRPDLNGGIKFQDGVLCEVVFTERAFDGKPILLDRPPDGPRNKPRAFTAYQEPEQIRSPHNPLGAGNPHACELTLYWEESNLGDTNNDGEVGLGDLAPIGRRYGQMSTDAAFDNEDCLPDADNNGEVNYRDVFLIQRHFGALLSGYRVYRRPGGSRAGSEQEELLPHRTNPQLPLSIHRPLAWDPFARISYRFIDTTLPYDGTSQRWIYRIVPFNARAGTEGRDSALEVELSFGPEGVRVLRGGQTSPRRLGSERSTPQTDESGREERDSRIQRGG